MPIKNRFTDLHAEITEWRHDFHRHPEIMFETHRTSALAAERLTAFGCDEIVTGIAKTGVIGVIKGKSATSGKVLGLRADMDALPIHEETGADYTSTIPGAMHACGHDGHTSMLLGAAKYLCETRNFDGTVVLIFQPAEEGGGGGKLMCDEGIMDRWGIQEVYSMHNWSNMEVGAFAIRPGPFFAATDQFEITLEGAGSHAASPQSSIDPVVITGQLITALQTIVSRNTAPVEQMVVSITSLETSTKAFNVIPQNVVLRGTVRTFREDLRDLAETRIRDLCTGITSAFGGTVEIDYTRSYPVMINSENQTEFAADAARAVSGACGEAPLVMGGEDFAYMLQHRPGAYIIMGIGDCPNHHHPEYDFNDEAIPAGCSWFAEIVEQRMPI